uniref:Uncharacterized protein n=1 Tax=Arundo donax TaxID=35708 RepID=A0A0A8XWS7_ARUDO
MQLNSIYFLSLNSLFKCYPRDFLQILYQVLLLTTNKHNSHLFSKVR